MCELKMWSIAIAIVEWRIAIKIHLFLLSYVPNIGPTFQIKRIQPFVKIKWENEYTQMWMRLWQRQRHHKHQTSKQQPWQSLIRALLCAFCMTKHQWNSQRMLFLCYYFNKAKPKTSVFWPNANRIQKSFHYCQAIRKRADALESFNH